jgi:phospholipid/cholesterol/gamma-HCH transport system substrate-binding protein
MDIHFNKKEKAVGTFLILIVLILVTVLLVIGRGKDWFKRYATYYTIFNESYNLQDDAAVKLYNTDIGKVKKIVLYKDKVKIELRILEDYAQRIKIDSVASVARPAFFYGTEYISIKPGSLKAPILPRGGEIPSEPRKSIEEMLTEYGIQEMAQKLIESIQNIFEIVERLKDPEGPLFTTLGNINKTTLHVEGITRDMQAGKGTMGQFLKSSELIETVLSELGRMDAILKDIQVASDRAPEIMIQFQASLDKVGDILNAVSENVSSIKTIMQEAEKGSHDLPELTRSAKVGLRKLRDTLDNANKVLESLQRNIFIRSNLPPETQGQRTDAGLRQ